MLVAAPLPKLEISAIVISKNCAEASSVETLLQSLENPSCPQAGDTQLVQVTIANNSKTSKRLGVEVQILHNGEIYDAKLPKRMILIPSFDEERVLHKFLIPPEGGNFQISAKIWDPGFKKLLYRSGPGVERQFSVPNSQTIEDAKEASIQSQMKEDDIRNPKKLEFDAPDLLWENVHIIPNHVLRGEKFKVRLDLVNVGGDIVKYVQTVVDYYNVRLPLRKTLIASPRVDIMAPGETITFELEYTLPDDQLLGEYQVIAVADPKDTIKESRESNNERKSNVIKLSDIKLLLPPDKFNFEEKGLFLFQWDSLVYEEFKIQVGVNEAFEEADTFFDLPQGDRWIADKEIVPLSGELPQMAQGLMLTFGKTILYWRVIGRNSEGRQSFSEIRSFSIKGSAATMP